MVIGPGTGEGFRLPLLLPGELMKKPLDGSRCDQRAQGFTATRGDAVLRVDATVDLPLFYLLNEGNTADAISIIESFLC
jgi:hypothetical protein